MTIIHIHSVIPISPLRGNDFGQREKKWIESVKFILIIKECLLISYDRPAVSVATAQARSVLQPIQHQTKRDQSHFYFSSSSLRVANIKICIAIILNDDIMTMNFHRLVDADESRWKAWMPLGRRWLTCPWPDIIHLVLVCVNTQSYPWKYDMR